MGEVEEKRNAPHINKANQFADQIVAVNELVKVKDSDFGKISEAAGVILREIRGTYNNREMSLVCTKLEEAIDWCSEKDAAHVKLKLTEAKNWCKAYVRVLSSD